MFGQDILRVPCDKCRGGYIGQDVCWCCDGTQRVTIVRKRYKPLGDRILMAAIVLASLGLVFWFGFRVAEWAAR